MKLQIEYLSPDELVTYENNAKIHTAEQIEQIKHSIQEFGMNDPIAVWKDNVIIEGHGRLIACKELGLDKVPVIRLDELTDEQRRAYMLVHNKLTMNTGYNWDMIENELDNIYEVDMGLYGLGDLFSSADEVDEYLRAGNGVETAGSGSAESKKAEKYVSCPYCGERVTIGA